MLVIFARHSATEWNCQGRAQGIQDIPLNERGIYQSKNLADKLAGFDIAKIYCSDLIRAKHTAKIISKKLGAKIKVDTRLRECSFGVLEGLPYQEFIKRCGKKNKPDNKNPLDFDFSSFGGDSCQKILEKYESFLRYAKRIHKNETILIVGHGRALRVTITAQGYPDLFPEQGSFITIRY